VYQSLPGKSSFRDRLHAFPFIEPHESFVTIDGTALYLNALGCPKQIAADRSDSITHTMHTTPSAWGPRC
jgi:hypothetical protein